ncbi:MarR family winged helix-turn-helix transcriptional regulator [Microbacterium sp. 20-116]|uniref:MarR family winged helix-turn-helix transcriptional regulator n=1 Tax=Microbacterium sp. 20-116 TaxID=3239883 RepID=UPI0034E1FD31
MASRLDDDEMRRWIAWKRATENVSASVASAIADATGLSSADFSVLTRVIEEGQGSIRQQRLSDELGWERSRLSRHLARMHDRGLVERGGDSSERRITATAHGRELTAVARAAHASAVRRALLDMTAHGAPFWPTIEKLGGA